MTYAERISPFRKKIKDPSTSMIIRLPIGTFDPLSQAGPVNLPENLRLNSYPPEVAGYYLVQFRGPVLEEWKGAVTDAGGQFFDYIPDFSFIVKMDQRTKRLVERMNSVRWVGIYQPGYRISPDLMSFMAKGHTGEKVDVIVTAFKGEPVSDLMERIQRAGGNILSISRGKWKNKIRVRIEPQQLVEIANLTGVKWIERAPEFELLPGVRKGGDR
jgi:hypothetical protein